MKISNKIKAFTVLELMVSIFITITIIASFYKLYNASIKAERNSSIRVSVNLLGEQILDTIAESMRMIGLNSQKGDLDADYMNGIFRQTKLKGGTGNYPVELKYSSSYGSPITKISNQFAESAMFPDDCKTVKLFNSAAFHNDVKKFYFHTQYGVITTDKNSTFSLGENEITITVNAFESGASLADKRCIDVFPAGTLVTGEDFIYTLKYTKSTTTGDVANSLSLTYADPETDEVKGTLVDFEYSPTASSDNKNDVYSMPYFVLEFLREKTVSGAIEREWVSSEFSYSDITSIIAVRFGFVLLSKKDRVSIGSDSPSTGDLPKYCIFDETKDGSTCYTLPSYNYTAYVFRRVVYLANFRLLKDSSNIIP